MRDMARIARAIARRAADLQDPTRLLGAAGAATIAALSLAAGSAAPALAATASPPTVTSSFTPNLIGAGGTSALALTITNPNASAALSAIAFTDTLPAGVVIDNPNGENGTCGSSGVVTATPGTNEFALTGGSLKAATNCTLSVAVTAAAAGVVENNTGLVSSSAGNSPSGDSETLTVLEQPTVTILTPKSNAVYRFDQKVKANFSCGQSDYTLGIVDCSALDDLGNTILDGQALDTNVPGAHQLSVYATSITGDVTTDTVNYKVQPDNNFIVKKVSPQRGGALRFTITLPGAGHVSATEIDNGRHLVATSSFKVSRAVSKRITVSLNAEGRALLANGPFKVRLSVTYKPTGGVARTLTLRSIKL